MRMVLFAVVTCITLLLSIGFGLQTAEATGSYTVKRGEAMVLHWSVQGTPTCTAGFSGTPYPVLPDNIYTYWYNSSRSAIDSSPAMYVYAPGGTYVFQCTGGGVSDSATLIVQDCPAYGQTWDSGSYSCVNAPATHLVRVPSQPTLGTIFGSANSTNIITCGTSGSDCQEPNVTQGTTVNFNATPSGSTFAGWTGACASFGTNPNCTVVVNGPVDVGGNFNALPPPPNPTITLTPSGGSSGTGVVTSNPPGINCPPTCTVSFPPNTPVTLTATPSGGSGNGTWAGGGGAGSCGSSPTCVITTPNTGGVPVTYTFNPGVTVTVTNNGGGSGSVSSNPGGITNCTSTSGDCTQPYTSGTSVTLTATPSGTSVFGGWGGGAASCGTNTTCTITISSNTTVTCTFDSPGNSAPVVNAGSDVVIVSPANTATPSGASAVDPNTPLTYLWQLVSGPNSPGITNPASLNPTFTGLVVGTYTFRFTATDSLGASNSDTMNVTVSPAAGTADLIPQNLNVPVSGTQGTSMNFSAFVRNAGTVGTGVGFSNNFSYRWGASGAWTDLPYIGKPALGAGVNGTVDNQSFTPAQSGTLYIQYCVDSAGQISEGIAGEGNNCTVSGGVSVNPPAGAPVPTLNVSNSNPPNNTSVNLTWTVTGTVNTCSIDNGIGNATTPSGSAATPLLTSPVTYTLTCNGPGGTGQDTVTVTPGAAPTPDLTPQNLTVPGSGTQGTSMNFSAFARNAGTVGTGVGFSNNFSYRWGASGAWTDLPYIGKPALGAGVNGTVDNQSFTPAQSGTLYIQYCVDSAGQISEGIAGEGNNCTVSGGVSVSAPATQCSDGSDNDGDTLTDLSDPGCSGGGDNDESNTACQGSIPSASGATRWDAEEETGVTNLTTNWTYSQSDTATKCQFRCPAGYGFTAGSCQVPTITQFEVCDLGTNNNCSNTVTLPPGGQATLRWNSTGAQSCPNASGPGFSGGGPNGSFDVTASAVPLDERTYTLICEAADGTPSNQRTITVKTQAVKPELGVSARIVETGSTITLNWNTNNELGGGENACTLSGGSVSPTILTGNTNSWNGLPESVSGTQVVTISGRTTFTLTCGTLSDVETVDVVPVGWES